MLLRGLLKSKDIVSNQRVYDHVVESVFRAYLLQPLALEVRLGQAATSMQMTPAGLEFSLPALYKFAVFEVQDPDPAAQISNLMLVLGAAFMANKPKSDCRP